jgi:hypothetical protein
MDSPMIAIVDMLVGSGDRLVPRLGQACNVGFYTDIAIFKGVCGNLECVTSTNALCSLERFFFNTEPGTTYHVLIRSINDISLVDLSIFVPPLVGNDLCSNAFPLTIGSTLSIDFTYATTDPSVQNDCNYDAFPGVWYTFVGTGERLVGRYLTCDMFSYAYMAIYTGDCSTTNRQCVAGSYLFCRGERFVFDTVKGTTYHVLIKAITDTASLNFSIFVSPPVVNDRCRNALPISIGATVYGNFTYATSDRSDVLTDCFFDYGPRFPGLWYRFVGTGERLGARLGKRCNATDFADTYLSLYTGDCGASTNLTCVNGTSLVCGMEPFLFDTVKGTKYHVLVQSYVDDAIVDFSIYSLTPSKPCGLFGWSIFCPFTFQGWLGRWIRGIFGF